MTGPAFSRVALVVAALAAAGPAGAQTASWIMSDILAAAKAEGSITVYSSVNEQEALPIWKEFEDATGIKVNYIRGNDSALTSKVLIEARSGQQSWDALVTTNVTRMPAPLRAKVELPEARALDAKFKDAGAAWHAVYANYNAPAYNTNSVKLDKPPRNLEEFLTHKEWAGHVGIDALEFPWMRGVVEYYGEDKGMRLLKQLFSEFKPSPVDGHLALARATAAGEYWVTPSNYVNLVNNVRSTGGPSDYWGADPVVINLGQVVVNPKAPHPNAARLAANFLISQQGQTAVARLGRLPVRSDVSPVPADAITKLGDVKTMPLEFTPDEEKTWQKRYQDLLRGL